MPAVPLFLGLDVGGTNIKAGAVNAEGVVLGRGSVPTGQADGCEIGLDRIEAAARAALDDAGLGPADVAAVGLATPGPMDLKSGTLLCPSNLPGWRDWPVRDAVAGRFGKPTVLQNDANAAAYGEYWSGAGRDADSLVLWTLGTGIGCGIILRGLVIEGEHSHGSECGHIIVDSSADARVHPGTGQSGTVEAYCGARGVVARTREALDAGRPSSLNDRIAGGAKLTPKLVCEAAAGGDELATELLTETARWLGIATVSVLHTIDPDAVLLAGAMTFGGPRDPDRRVIPGDPAGGGAGPGVPDRRGAPGRELRETRRGRGRRRGCRLRPAGPSRNRGGNRGAGRRRTGRGGGIGRRAVRRGAADIEKLSVATGGPRCASFGFDSPVALRRGNDIFPHAGFMRTLLSAAVLSAVAFFGSAEPAAAQVSIGIGSGGVGYGGFGRGVSPYRSAFRGSTFRGTTFGRSYGVSPYGYGSSFNRGFGNYGRSSFGYGTRGFGSSYYGSNFGTFGRSYGRGYGVPSYGYGGLGRGLGYGSVGFGNRGFGGSGLSLRIR